ncbi:MAG: hypothetical protein AAF714_11080 [Pseudomonadota bacterium]
MPVSTPMLKTLSTSTMALATAQVAILAPLLPSIATAESTDHLLPVDLELANAQTEVTGQVFLTRADAEVSEFILVSDMGFCPWCGSADHGIAVEVQLDQAMALEHGAQITVSGALETLQEGDHLATRMVGAEIL